MHCKWQVAKLGLKSGKVSKPTPVSPSKTEAFFGDYKGWKAICIWRASLFSVSCERQRISVYFNNSNIFPNVSVLFHLVVSKTLKKWVRIRIFLLVDCEKWVHQNEQILKWDTLLLLCHLLSENIIPVNCGSSLSSFFLFQEYPRVKRCTDM